MLRNEYKNTVNVFTKENNRVILDSIERQAMTPEEFTNAIASLGWKQSDFCRKSGVTKQTPSRWANGQSPIPLWVPAYLGAMQDLAALHTKYIAPAKGGD